MAKVHRDTDSRACGATTNAQSNGVFVNSKKISINGDPNSHGGGGLTASANQVYANGKLIVLNGDGAAADALCPTLNADHCAPKATNGSSNVFSG